MKTFEIFKTNVYNNEEAERLTIFFEIRSTIQNKFDLENEENIVKVEAINNKFEIYSK